MRETMTDSDDEPSRLKRFGERIAGVYGKSKGGTFWLGFGTGIVAAEISVLLALIIFAIAIIFLTPQVFSN
jgi:hypothetical protein